MTPWTIQLFERKRETDADIKVNDFLTTFLSAQLLTFRKLKLIRIANWAKLRLYANKRIHVLLGNIFKILQLNAVLQTRSFEAIRSFWCEKKIELMITHIFFLYIYKTLIRCIWVKAASSKATLCPLDLRSSSTTFNWSTIIRRNSNIPCQSAQRHLSLLGMQYHRA